MQFHRVVTLPAGIESVVTPDFTRNSEDGAISCFVDPIYDLPFRYLDPTNSLAGMVKCYTTYNLDSVETLVTNPNEVLKPDYFYFKNGLTKLNVVNDGVEYYYWNNATATYILLDKFTFGKTITMVKPLFINSNVAAIQIEDTKWVLRQGRPFVRVKHNTRELGYTLKNTYYHDGTTTSNPASGATISMQTQLYTDIYNSGDAVKLLLVKSQPSNIKSNSLLTTETEAIGHIFTADIGYNTSDNVSKEFFTTNTPSIYRYDI